MWTIEFIIGEEYPISDFMREFPAKLVGYIINQIPVNWQDKSSYGNHMDSRNYMVFEYVGDFGSSRGKTRYCTAMPALRTYLRCGTDVPQTDVYLNGLNYADLIEDLVKQLKANWIFTKELSYDAYYKEGYKA